MWLNLGKGRNESLRVLKGWSGGGIGGNKGRRGKGGGGGVLGCSFSYILSISFKFFSKSSHHLPMYFSLLKPFLKITPFVD